MRPAYITATRSAVSATTPRSWVMRISGPALAAQIPEDLEDLRLRRDVERGRRLVGDDEVRARRRSPWRSSRAGACRPTSDADSRRSAAPDRRCERARTALRRRRAPLSRSRPRCSSEHLGDLRTDPYRRVERSHRLLEDHADAIAADAGDKRSCAAAISTLAKADRAFCDEGRRVREEPHDRRAPSGFCPIPTRRRSPGSRRDRDRDRDPRPRRNGRVTSQAGS